MTPIHETIERQVDATPAAAAVQCGSEVLTYGELDARANRLARLLRAYGAGPDRVVAVALPRSVDLVVAVLGVLKAGSAFLPLDPEQPPARAALMLADGPVSAVVTNSVAVPAELMATLAAHPADLVCLRRDAEILETHEPTRPGVPVHPRNLAYVIHTSGSTGRPKAAMNEHEAMANRLHWMQRTFGLTPGEGVLHKTPVSFDVSLWELFWPLLVGARCVVARPSGHLDPVYLAELIDTAAVSTVHFVPTLLAAFLAAVDGGAVPPSALRRIVCSGEELPSALLSVCARVLPDAAVFNLYGPAEAAIDVMWHRCRPDDQPWVPLGLPIDGATVQVTGPAGEPVPPGTRGELILGGMPVGRGYRNRPGLTAERFVPDPFGAPGARRYRTGDAVRVWADGRMQFLGRLDRQVKLYGVRIEPGEIEAVLAGHPCVESAVVDLRRSGGSAELLGWVRPRGEAGAAGPVLGRQLRAYLRERLPVAMVPVRIMTVRQWPAGPHGKLDRRSLPER
ncbi:amino acid adenylation domain-containing protein [Micromonospora sp. NPDC048999]|uniref:amino acid adenylation domain-containing protein n=1 Tax=Micromonospora sp. NPDC048999 TaxID=3155391 RepID=UPI0033D4AA28